MGSKTRGPVASDYAPTDAEKTAAAVAKADSDYFAKAYDPLLKEMRDKAAKKDVASTYRGRAQADSMQGLTGNLDMSVVDNINASANIARGAVSNILGASTTALSNKRKEQAGVLAAARGQEANTGTALGASSRIAAAQDLNKTKNEQAIRRARRGALMDTAMAAGSQMATNVSQTNNPFARAGSWEYDADNEQMKRRVYNPLGGSGSFSDPNADGKSFQLASQYFKGKE
mgnify:CR=1|tara:strand:- start:5218 stop:5907 length:690 start_codon:yes stop_codon:yes gene_type:complete